MNNVEQLLVFGYKGKLVIAGTYSEIVSIDEMIKRDGKNYPFLTHYAEMDFEQRPQVFPVLPDETSDYHRLRQQLLPVYHSYGKYGDFGDVLFVIKTDHYYILTGIGRKLNRHPELAADLLPIIVDSRAKAFFIGIIRGSDESHGTIATIGGFIDILSNGEMESAPECLVHEAREEVGLELSLGKAPAYTVYDTPFPNEAVVLAHIFQGEFPCIMHRLGIYYSPPSQLRPQFKTKRIHAAAGYVLPIYLNRAVSVETLRKELVPRDLQENNQVYIWEMGKGSPGFANPGHLHMYEEAARFARIR